MFCDGRDGASDYLTNTFRLDDSWTALSGLPMGVDNAAGAVWSNELYCIGGYGTGGSGVLSNVFAFDGTTWREAPGLPGKRQGPGAAVLHSSLYAVGGLPDTHSTGQTNVWRFNSTNWQEVAGLPQGRYYLKCATLNDRLYAIGGEQSGQTWTNVFVFDGTNWSETAGLPARGVSDFSVVYAPAAAGAHTAAVAIANNSPTTPYILNLVGSVEQTGTQTGTLAISVTPANGSWQLSGPLKYSGVTNGTGCLAAMEVPVGRYAVQYDLLTGYRTPSSQTQEVTEGGFVTFTGNYLRREPPADFGGEGVTDLAVYDERTGQWYIWSPETGLIAWGETLGGLGYEPVAGDFNGDGQTDLCVYCNGYWFIRTVDGTMLYYGENWGAEGYEPVGR